VAAAATPAYINTTTVERLAQQQNVKLADAPKKGREDQAAAAAAASTEAARHSRGEYAEEQQIRVMRVTSHVSS